MSKYMKGFTFYAVSNLDDRIANADQVRVICLQLDGPNSGNTLFGLKANKQAVKCKPLPFPLSTMILCRGGASSLECRPWKVDISQLPRWVAP